MVSTPQNEALNRRSQEHCSLTDKMSARTALRILSTIYPKSRFCTKRHKRLDFHGFSGVFEGFSQNAEKENCKFEAQKYKSVFEFVFGALLSHKPLLRRLPLAPMNRNSQPYFSICRSIIFLTCALM